MDDDDMPLQLDRYPHLAAARARRAAARVPPSTDVDIRRRMVPVVAMPAHENLKRGDRVVLGEKEYTVEETPKMDAGAVRLSQPAEAGGQRVHFTATAAHRPYLRAVRPPQEKLDLTHELSGAAHGPCAEKVLFVDPLNHTTMRDRRMFYELQQLGYALRDMRSVEYATLKEYISDTDKRSKVDGAGSFCAAEGAFTTPAGWMRGLMQASHKLHGPAGTSSHRYHYVMACFDGARLPLSVLIYGYGTAAGQVEVVALCANQRREVRQRRARGVGRELLRDLCAVCDAIAAKMKVESVQTAVSMYAQFGFQAKSYTRKGPGIGTIMVRDAKRGGTLLPA